LTHRRIYKLAYDKRSSGHSHTVKVPADAPLPSAKRWSQSSFLSFLHAPRMPNGLPSLAIQPAPRLKSTAQRSAPLRSKKDYQENLTVLAANSQIGTSEFPPMQ
jgi:hypothetical protein